MNRRKAMITGASSGIGKSFAYELAKAGFDLVLVARRGGLLDEIKKELESKYRIFVENIQEDLSDLKGVQNVCDKVKEIDLLINNTGVGLFSSFLKSDLKRDLNIIDLNIKSVYYFTKIYSERMAKNKNGGIINVASLVGFKPYPNVTVYSATKSFVLSFTQSVSRNLTSMVFMLWLYAPVPHQLNSL